MNSDSIKRAVKKWAASLGREKAYKRLRNDAGISHSVTVKLLGGQYECRLGLEKAMAILAELKKDGVSLTDEKAS